MALPSKEKMAEELRKDGWNTLWHEDNWVAPDATNPDWAGMNIVMAYKVAMNRRYKKTGDPAFFY